MTTYKRGSALRRALARLMRRPQTAVRASEPAGGRYAVPYANQVGQLGMLPLTRTYGHPEEIVIETKYTKPPANDTAYAYPEPLFTYDGFGTPIPRKRSG